MGFNSVFKGLIIYIAITLIVPIKIKKITSFLVIVFVFTSPPKPIF